MANELFGTVGTTGSTVYAVIWNSTNQVWNGSAYVNYSSGNFSQYINAVTEIGVTGCYGGSIPAGALSAWIRATYHIGATESVATALQTNTGGNTVVVGSFSAGAITDAAFATSSQAYKSHAFMAGKSTFDSSTQSAIYYAVDGVTVAFTDTRSVAGTVTTRTVT